MLSTKDLKYQMVDRWTEKLTERFVGPYKIKKIVSSNAVELELPGTVKIHLCYDLAKWLSHFFCFVLFYLVRSLLRWSMGKHHVTVTKSQSVTLVTHLVTLQGHSHNM